MGDAFFNYVTLKNIILNKQSIVLNIHMNRGVLYVEVIDMELTDYQVMIIFIQLHYEKEVKMCP